MNKIDAKTRSKIMSKVRSRDTKMELAVRLVMEALGFIYCPKDIVGRPKVCAAKSRWQDSLVRKDSNFASEVIGRSR